MQLGDILGKVSVQKPLAWKNLQVFPLVQPNGHEPGYAILDDLLDRKQVEVTEIDDGGHVPTIKVLNKADIDALILDGTELHGAKQNRMVNVTVVVGKGTETEIPVSCVEQGRWSHRAGRFASSRHTVASKLRNRKAHMVNENLARMKLAATDQGQVWGHVEDYLAKAEASSPTAAMDDAFTARAPEVEEFVDQLKDLDAYGAVVAVNGEIVALDLLDHRQTFKKLWVMLLRGYAMDASLEEAQKPKSVTQRRVQNWLRTLRDEATMTRHAVPGVGEYYSVIGPAMAGGLVKHEGRVIHVAVFPTVE
jgi:hypothetical protein